MPLSTTHTLTHSHHMHLHSHTHVLCTHSVATSLYSNPIKMWPTHLMQQALHADTCPLYMEPSTTCRHMSPVHAAKHYMQTHVPCTWSHVSWHAGWVRPGQTGRLAATHWKWRLELYTLEECDTPTMVCDWARSTNKVRKLRLLLVHISHMGTSIWSVLACSNS